MNGPFSSGGLGGSGFDAFSASAGKAISEVMEQLRSAFEPRPASSRMARGDVRAAVLSLLAEQPMHGYQIIREIDERSGGTWKPSAGSVYPTLQMLADEGLITAEEVGDRKTYSLTDMGRAEAEASDGPAPWTTGAATRERGHHTGLAKAGVDLASATAEVGRTGTPEQLDRATAILEDARRKLYAILADS